MKRIRYSKYIPDPASEMSLEELLSALSNYLLQSGFNDNFWYEMPQGEQTLDELRRAIEQALLSGDMFDEGWNIFPPVAQGGQDEWKDEDAVE